MTYRPLPDSLTIGLSTIDGLGLIATEVIKENTELGLFHYYVNKTEIIRTPLAGFVNHSDTPNCIKTKGGYIDCNRSYLVTIRDIQPGEELTLKYDLYKI